MVVIHINDHLTRQPIGGAYDHSLAGVSAQTQLRIGAVSSMSFDTNICALHRHVLRNAHNLNGGNGDGNWP